MGEAPARWRAVAEKYGLAEPDVNKLVSWWHTDGDLGRQIECVNDMGRSRRLGFTAYQETRASFLHLFQALRHARIVPA